MALRNKSLLLYGFQVTELNRSIDFVAVLAGPELNATLSLGFYSLTALAAEIKRAMQTVDPANTYSVSVDRTINGGTENRVTITTSGAYLDLLFATGSRAASTVAPLIGFSGDQTGATTYQGTLTAGTALLSEYTGYQYLSDKFWRKVQGNVTVTANGTKEAVVWQVQKFVQVQFKYEPEAKVISEWTDFVDWAIQQRLFEFTPDYVTGPSTFFEVTLERTSDDGKGLGWKWTEMLPNFPFNYDSGILTFRERQD